MKPCMRMTPVDLRIMRARLGLSQQMAAALIGAAPKDYRILERPVTRFVYKSHAEILAAIDARMEMIIDRTLESKSAAPEFLICFTSTESFERYEPELAAWMRFNEVHLNFTARLEDAWQSLGHYPKIGMLVHNSYATFLSGSGGFDSPETRVEWMRQFYCEPPKEREGMPEQRPAQTGAWEAIRRSFASFGEDDIASNMVDVPDEHREAIMLSIRQAFKNNNDVEPISEDSSYCATPAQTIG